MNLATPHILETLIHPDQTDSHTGICRCCGCDEHHPCVIQATPSSTWHQAGEPCWWVEPNLCAACSEDIDQTLIWKHPGQNDEPPPLTAREKATFAWVTLAISAGILDLTGLIN